MKAKVISSPAFIEKFARLSVAERKSLTQAYQLARDAHRGQRRRSGEAYISHPIAVATILYDWKVDIVTMQAGLLHDVVEDTSVSLEDIRRDFGEDVAELVDGVTKIGLLHTRRAPVTKNSQSLENIRKLLVAMSHDIRVIIVKLADRLHNMRTIAALPQEKQRRIARETLDVYAPIADRLGVGDVKAELEDLAFAVLQPDEFSRLKKQARSRIQAAQQVVDESVSALGQSLGELGLSFEIEFRIKHLYSLYRKLAKYDQDFSKIRDLVAMRIITDTPEDCYRVLGAVHSLYRPLPHFIKDYIAVPKPNGYQSIHTTVLSRRGIFEVQIRTRAMHEYAEHGLAAHFYYDSEKERHAYKQNTTQVLPKKFKWIQNLLDWQEQMVEEKDLQDGLRLDLFKERIFVFSPKGDLYDLPVGATPVDFAFQIHTQLGLACRGVKVNGQIVPLDHPLENRDVVEIFAFHKEPKPSRDWLSFVVTAKARTNIKNWFMLADQTAEVQEGRRILDEYLTTHRHTGWRQLKVGQRSEVLARLGEEDESALFVAICEGRLEPSEVVRELMYRHALVVPHRPLVNSLMRRRRTARPVALIPGIEREHVSRAGCCSPQYPERIVGFVSRLGAIRIHSENCDQIDDQKERCVPAYWYYDSSDKVKLTAEASALAQTLRTLSHHLHSFDAKARSISQTVHGEQVVLEADLALVRMDKLPALLAALRRIPGVLGVEHIVKSR